MNFKKHLSKIIEYEKKVKGKEFYTQVLIVSLIMTIIATKYRSYLENKEYENKMNEYINEYLIENKLIFPEDIISNSPILMPGNVLAYSMDKYDINLIVAGDCLITKDGRQVKIVTYGTDEFKNISYFLEDEEYDIPDTISILIIKSYAQDDIKKNYDLVISTDILRKIFNYIGDKQEVTTKLVLKKK